MKKLLSMLAVSTLVGTSVSSLKPLFTSNVSQGFKSNQTNTNINIKGENDNPFISKINDGEIISSAYCSNGNMFLLKSDGLYKSTDGTNFIKISSNIDNFKNHSMGIDINGAIYIGTSDGLYKSTDKGQIFNIVNNTKGFYIQTIVILESDNSIYFSEYFKNNLYKSTDGTNFIKISSNPSLSDRIINFGINTNGVIYLYSGQKFWISKDDGQSFINITTNYPSYESINTIVFDSYGTVYVGGLNHMFISFDETKTFKKVDFNFSEILIPEITTILINSKNIYIGTNKGLENNDGFYKLDLVQNVINFKKPNYMKNGFVYKDKQTIDLKVGYLKSAILDEKSLSIPSSNVPIDIGKHTLILTLKDEYKKYLDAFGGNNGQITYNFWIKTSIDKKDINYSTKTDDTDLTNLSLGFVSTSGNTNGCPIIQTKTKNGSGIHNAPLTTTFTDSLIDYTNSFYVQGIVVEATNDFTEIGSKQRVLPTIANDGTYHLHLVDTVGNTYDSYLELGENNWKLQGTFKDDKLDELRTKLNVTVNLTDPKQLAQATGWLTNYDKFATDLFEQSVKTNGKGFDEKIKADKKNDFTWFLNSLTYDINNEPKFTDGLDKHKLDQTIRDIAKKFLQDDLVKLPQNLNVDTKNVVNKSTLDSYSIWIKEYEKFVNSTKDQWISDVVKVASRGFATTEQINQIADHIRGLDFKNYLKNIVWEDNKLLIITSNKYQKYVELDKLQSDTINWVNQNISQIDELYQQALKTAESGLKLHGYSINTLLNGKNLPQTKNEIGNFADGQSFHSWLQSQANIKFHGWQLTMGLCIGIPLFLIAIGIAWFVRKATDPRYNPFARGKKYDKNKKKGN